MNIRHLQTFSLAAERQSFTDAARALQLTQAAISQHVAALEKALGTDLFERHARGVRLTDPGRQLYRYAQQILELVAEASRAVGVAEPSVSGQLRIASSTVPSETWLPEMLIVLDDVSSVLTG